MQRCEKCSSDTALKLKHICACFAGIHWTGCYISQQKWVLFQKERKEKEICPNYNILNLKKYRQSSRKLVTEKIKHSGVVLYTGLPYFIKSILIMTPNDYFQEK